jgi:lipopolysaccharide/colanic/teichoic acid biosynthesis glycosyltransferase
MVGGGQRVQRRLKRLLDVSVSLPALVLLAPLLLLVGAGILFSMGRPVLFRQVRAGLGGERFTLVKFRSMNAGKGCDEERLTSFGRWLRRTSLDELPELWNVLVGDMSLVGPRPLLVEYLDHYTGREAKRHNMRPGITGLAQVAGRNRLDWKEQLELDVRYVESWSLALDFKILLRTPLVVLFAVGARQTGHATRERLTDAKQRDRV